MDPDVTLREARDTTRSLKDRIYSYVDLIAWRDCGGFLPTGVDSWYVVNDESRVLWSEYVDTGFDKNEDDEWLASHCECDRCGDDALMDEGTIVPGSNTRKPWLFLCPNCAKGDNNE